MKHTPGPWTCDIGERNGEYIIPEISNHLDSLEYYPPDNKFDETEEANARLIAAAPLLLKVIRAMAKCCEEALNDDWDRSDDGFEAMLQQCQEAIAAATE